ncbi:Crotonobetainyl-CoA:carnitine CoA-transferase CaiB [Rhizobiales bacterium GAS191]|jgi:crotonobetainyl-CoA:carnitine CoA-transferase CaiB-like acyl-CoA transferase|nr:Crotonobetainyl-CoA:carnitine CoA-transferase CaiB [Rhizobiales bacterium GAS113]SED92826.1 Crotonobetainyl-CoA:carnitine CoA-transferase CaiB [Rhizobiales bacterium GAS191]
MLLTGVRVIELGQALAAPFAAEILADLGAEVIKAEKPDGGDDARHWGPPFWGEDAALFHQMNRNKTSMTVDLKDETERARFIELIGTQDVFLHNLRPGVAATLGIGAAGMRQRFPRLIYGELGAFGHRGPLADKPGYELLLQAFGGLMSVTGEPGRGPVRCGPSIVDLGTGMWAAIGILAALVRRAATGEGCLIQTSLFETALCWGGIHSANYFASGKAPQAEGAGHPSLVPYGAFETGTGPLIIGAGNDRLFAKLALVLGHPEWKDDPRFSENSGRVQNRAALTSLINEALAGGDKEAWAARLEAAGVPAAPILDVPAALAHEQTAALGMVQDGELGVRSIAAPLSIDGERPAMRRSAPAFGG